MLSAFIRDGLVLGLSYSLVFAFIRSFIRTPISFVTLNEAVRKGRNVGIDVGTDFFLLVSNVGISLDK